MLGKLLKRLETFSLPILSRRTLVLLWLAGIVLFVALLAWLLRDKLIAVLEPRGVIAEQQRDLLYFATALSVLVLGPTYYMLYTFAWKYRDGHTKQYRPKWDSNKRLEAVWWGIPIAIIAVLAVVTWTSSHNLDPYRAIASSKEPLKVQVIALQWKWLFIYPEQNIASVNRLVLPVDRPIEFTITSDAPMNSFWIPQLAGQIYAMSGMSTKLNINATSVGEYRGMSSNLSGAGFADMTFMADVRSENDFIEWSNKLMTDSNKQVLSQAIYTQLSKPGKGTAAEYRVENESLYESVIMKYMDSDHDEMQKPTTHPSESER